MHFFQKSELMTFCTLSFRMEALFRCTCGSGQQLEEESVSQGLACDSSSGGVERTNDPFKCQIMRKSIEQNTSTCMSWDSLQ